MNKADLGAIEDIVKPHIRRYVVELIIGIAAIVTTLLFPGAMDYAWLGLIPLIILFPLLGMLIAIFAVIGIMRINKTPQELEIFQNGVAMGDFVSHYATLSIEWKRGFSANKLLLNDGERTVIFDYPISPKQLKKIHRGIQGNKKTGTL